MKAQTAHVYEHRLHRANRSQIYLYNSISAISYGHNWEERIRTSEFVEAEQIMLEEIGKNPEWLRLNLPLIVPIKGRLFPERERYRDHLYPGY